VSRRDEAIVSIPRKRLREILLARCATSGECWEWTAYRDKDGYGDFCYNPGTGSVKLRAHRMAFYLEYGHLPRMVCHHCDNPPCIRPAHLFGGNAADNSRDSRRKGRHVHGLRHPRIRIAPALREHIRRRYTAGEATQDELAAEFDVSRSAISHIIGGRVGDGVPIDGNALRRRDKRRRSFNAAKTHCPRGHAYDKRNTSISASGDRRCRTCAREAMRRKRESGRAACEA
jgi:hypothetical protein